MNLSPSSEWMSNRVQGLVGGTGRLAMKEHIKLAETAWARTVRERHDLIRKDWGTADKMEL